MRDPRSRQDGFGESEETAGIEPDPRIRAELGIDSEDPDAVIARLVRRGVVTHQDLVAAGVTEGAIRFRLKQKRLIRQWKGVYLIGHADPATFALEYAALKFAGPGAALSDRPAAALWTLLPKQADPTIHLSLREKRASPPGLKLHARDLLPQEVTTIHQELRITTPARTILDVAPTLGDTQLENVVADALRRNLATERQLQAQLELRKGARGSTRLTRLLDDGPRWTASEAERRMLTLIRKAGLPLPESNPRTGDMRPDLVWREQRVLVEIDSWRWHGRDAIAFGRDRGRDRRARLNGWTVLRFTTSDLRDRPFEVVAQLAAALA